MSGLESLQHRRVQLGQPVHEFVDVAGAERRRNQPFEFHARQFEPQPHLATENDELSRDVGSRQIVARIRFGIAVRLRDAYDFGKGLLAVPDVEEIRERAGENSFNPPDLVAGLAQVTQRLDDWQPGADGRFIEVVRSCRTPRLVEIAVELERYDGGAL